MMIFDEKSDFFRENRQFLPLIRYYANRIKSDTAEVDLWEFLWLLQAKKQPPSDNYVAVCLRNEYIKISKNIPKYCALDFGIAVYDRGLDTKIDLKNALFRLTKKERETIILLYYYGFSVEEIGTLHGVSRQAVNQTKNRALERLRNLVK